MRKKLTSAHAMCNVALFSPLSITDYKPAPFEEQVKELQSGTIYNSRWRLYVSDQSKVGIACPSSLCRLLSIFIRLLGVWHCGNVTGINCLVYACLWSKNHTYLSVLLLNFQHCIPVLPQSFKHDNLSDFLKESFATLWSTFMCPLPSHHIKFQSLPTINLLGSPILPQFSTGRTHALV